MSIVTMYEKSLSAYQVASASLEECILDIDRKVSALEKKEASIVLAGTIDGKNEQQRKAQMFSLVEPLVVDVSNAKTMKNVLELRRDTLKQEMEMYNAFLRSGLV